MIDTVNFSLFLATSWALIMAPGPDMLYVITRGVSQGRRAGLISALGVTLGILVHTFVAAIGLAVLLQTSALAFSIFKYGGVLYLVYLGIRSLKAKSGFEFADEVRIDSLSQVFWQGVFSNVLNPKVALFFLAFLPQFVASESGYATLQMIMLGIIFACFGGIFLCLVSYFAGGLGSWLVRRPHRATLLRWLTGTILIGLGLRLATVKNRQ